MAEETTKQRGSVVSFDRSTATGVVLVGTKQLKFWSTCFFAAPTRWPLAGESVDVVFSKAKTILCVQAIE